MPRQAALKAPRRLEPADTETEASRKTPPPREGHPEAPHLRGMAWREDAPEDKPDRMSSAITEANVSNRDTSSSQK
jgi:hypothetical protein